MKILPATFNELKQRLLDIKSKGRVRCSRPNNTNGGIGNTLEDLLSIKENNLQAADFLDYEIKSQRISTNSPITLFSMATENKGNKRLFNEYSRKDADSVQRLYWTVYMNKTAQLYDNYICQLKFDDEINPKQLILSVYNNLTKELNENFYWNLNTMRNNIENKMRNLVACHADSLYINNIRYYEFNNFECYFDFDFSLFIDALKKGLIQVDFRIGADLFGNNAGKYHDHGTGFRINSNNLRVLYRHFEIF